MIRYWSKLSFSARLIEQDDSLTATFGQVVQPGRDPWSIIEFNVIGWVFWLFKGDVVCVGLSKLLDVIVLECKLVTLVALSMVLKFYKLNISSLLGLHCKLCQLIIRSIIFLSTTSLLRSLPSSLLLLLPSSMRVYCSCCKHILYNVEIII